MNIIGIFDHLSAQQFPAVHPSCDLALGIEMAESEIGQPAQIRLKIVDADGLSSMDEAVINHLVNGPIPEWRHTSPVIVKLHNLVFSSPGDYELQVWLQNVLAASLSLTLVQNSTPDQENSQVIS